MPLTGSQIDQVVRAITAAYTRSELRRVVRTCMDLDFDTLVSEGTYSQQVFELVTWAIRTNRLAELIECVYSDRNENEELSAVYRAYGKPKPKQRVPEQEPVNPELPQLPRGRYVFLAYSRADSATMRRLRADLRAAGIAVWVDDEDLEPGTPVWQRSVQNAIRKAQCMVVLMSPTACESPWVNSEITTAMRWHLRIVPVLARGNEDDAVPLALASIHYVDIRVEYEDTVQRHLIPAVRKVVERSETAQPLENDASKTIPSGAAETPKAEQLQHMPTLNIDWVPIPAGTFLMGSDKSKDAMAYTDETPQHIVNLHEYYISKYPVTNAQYQHFVLARGHKLPAHWKNGHIPQDTDDHPVTNVSWHDAAEYCTWASTVAGHQVRLPSEAEWEKAARGTDGRIWPWGNQPPTDKLCNFNKIVGSTSLVGSYPLGASPYGVMDMAGNVWEWTADWYASRYYTDSVGTDNPTGPTKGPNRTLRGGAWHYEGFGVRCAFRYSLYPDFCGHFVGFRVVSTPT